MLTVLTVTHVVVTITLIVLVLIQRGKGADVGAAFGSGASNTVFGSQGSASFLTRTTAVLATLFFVISLTLAYMTSQLVGKQTSVTDVGVVVDDGAPADIPVLSEPDTDLPPVPE
ncbi:MAG TPA: preprotein translocase subunit SecG [Gammaproteobacteria bacterium]|nr:preprotein translocase subunit SecG [Gammaproteobacteria bacterium]